MTDILETTPVDLNDETATVYVLMQRYKIGYWFAVPGVYETIKAARTAADTASESVTAWRIVKVENLPIDVPEGQV